MKKIMVSACLLGNPVRYDGRSKLLENPALEALITQQRVISFCPEVAGGLPVPRPAAEINGGDGHDVVSERARVCTEAEEDVTDYFVAGARRALALCRKHDIDVAILTESSPSCGSSQVYDGSFSRNAVAGSGVTTALLRQHGIRVFNQFQLEAACRYLESSERERVQ